MSKDSEPAEELRKECAAANVVDDDEEEGRNEPVAVESGSSKESALSKAALAPLRLDKDDEGYLFNHPRARLGALPVGEKQPAAPETETLLNGLIGECGTLLRDVAFRSACLTPDASDRLRFIAAAESLALTASKVADTIGRLRHGGQPAEVRRHEMVYTLTTPPLPPPAAKGDNQ